MNEFTLKSAALTLLLNNHIELVASNPRTRNIYVAGSENFTAIPNLSEFYIPLRKVMESLSLTVKTSEPDGDDVSIRGVRVIDDIGVEDITITEEVSGSMEIPQYIIGQLETPYGVTKINDEYITTWEALVKKVRAKFLMTDIDAVCSICAAAIYIEAKSDLRNTDDGTTDNDDILPKKLAIVPENHGEIILTVGATTLIPETLISNVTPPIIVEDGIAPMVYNVTNDDVGVINVLLARHNDPYNVVILKEEQYDELNGINKLRPNTAYVLLTK